MGHVMLMRLVGVIGHGRRVKKAGLRDRTAVMS